MRKILCIALELALAITSSLPASADPLGETYIAGNTWRELQWAWSVEDMIALDTISNSVYVTWTYSPEWPMDYLQASYFNCFSAGRGWVFDEPGLDMFPGVFNQLHHSIMIAGNTGTWSDIEIGFESLHLKTMRAWWQDRQFQRMQLDTLNWPDESIVSRACGPNGMVHSLGYLRLTNEDFLRLYYGRYQVDPFVFSGWEFVDTLTYAYKIAASPVSDRVAFTYQRQRDFSGPEVWFFRDRDIYLLDSPDGSEWDWQGRRNITEFSDSDIFRPFADVDIFIDHNDQIHVAFTTWEIRINPEYPERMYVNPDMAFIWHWSESADSFSVVADGWIPPPGCCFSATQLAVNRPQIAENPGDGKLYLIYERGNCDDVSNYGGYPNSDLWVSASTDDGLNWSTGINFTDTQTPNCPIQECESEIQPSITNLVNDTLHVVYILDKSTGIWQFDEGRPRESKVVYQKAPADLIPTEPLIPQFSIRSDPWTGVGDNPEAAVPDRISFFQNYPNPFNDATTLKFYIPQAGRAILSVYDIQGQKVATLMDDIQQAGVHTVVWDASELASGIYFLKLSTGSGSITRKAVLLK